MEHERRAIANAEKAPAFRARWAFIGFAAIAAFFLIAEHKAHLYEVLPYWPYLLLLACPLLHMFMHGGHGGREGHKHNQSADSDTAGDRR